MAVKLGFDIGNNSVKIAELNGEHSAVHEIRMPENMMDDGEIAMPNSFSAFLRQEMRARKIKGRDCALVLPARQVICRLVTLPKMNEEQLALNLPYEFNEFVQNDPERFFFDYAMCEKAPEDDPEQMVMMAAAASKDRITQYIRIFSGAGLKLKTLLPPEMALMRLTERRRAEGESEYCFVNLGQDTVNITIIKNDRVRAMRRIETGCSAIDAAIADMMNIDPFLAGTYKFNNFQGVLDTQEADEVYQRIAIEILRVVNFYRFNFHQDSELQGLYLLGGGAAIGQLTNTIREMLEMPVLPLSGLIQAQGLDAEAAAKGALAIGVAMG